MTPGHRADHKGTASLKSSTIPKRCLRDHKSQGHWAGDMPTGWGAYASSWRNPAEAAGEAELSRNHAVMLSSCGVGPDRAANSHSASVGRRKPPPGTRAFRRPIHRCASFQDMLCTGIESLDGCLDCPAESRATQLGSIRFVRDRTVPMTTVCMRREAGQLSSPKSASPPPTSTISTGRPLTRTRSGNPVSRIKPVSDYFKSGQTRIEPPFRQCQT